METEKRLIEVQAAKEFASTFLADPILKMAVNAVLDNAPTVKDINVPSWIPVTERPKERGEYLCYFKFEPESPDVVGSNFYFGSGIWMSATDNVTHWMPMPEPPKGE